MDSLNGEAMTGEPLGEVVDIAEVRKAKERPPLPDGFRYTKHGAVEYRRKPQDDQGEDGNGKEAWDWLCSPIEVLAETRGEDGEGWGLLIRVKDADHAWHTRAIPRALFLAEGGEIFQLLHHLGLKITAAKAGKERLRAMLCMSNSAKRGRIATRVGWYNASTFLLPDEAFGELSDERIVFQSEHPVPHNYRLKGTLDGWRNEVAARALGNSRMIFGAAAAFAGPLLQPLNIEGGGFHLRGDSSTGKTSSLWVAGSVWGGGPLLGFTQSWRTTDNAMEGRAVQHSDTLLPMDELSQATAQAAARMVYFLGNGQGKARAGVAGEGRPVAEFRVMFLSTGEVSLAAKLAEDGIQPLAGQETRFVDLEADAGASMGAFENIHGAISAAAFSDAIRAASNRHYGHACRAYLRKLLADPQEAFAEARTLMAAFSGKVCPENATGQVERVAKRFALVAAAGELASQWGILPWPDGTTMDACARMFREWLARRGTPGALEGMKAIAQVRAMIEKHGASRFVPWNADGASTTPVINRLGFVKRDGEFTTYYVMPEMFKTEICKGLDQARVVRELVRIGAITPDKNRKTASLVWLPGIGGTRCYAIDPAKLFATSEGE
jgi:putative DNA primase/helicase